MQKITRRKFIKLATAVAGAVTVGKITPALAQNCMDCHRRIPKGAPPHKWVPTCCLMCGGTTGILCNVVDGRVTKIEPNPNNPVGISNISTDFLKHKKEGAAMCPRGNAGIMTLYDPDRVKKPLKRTNPEKGKGVDPKWKEITWGEAIDEISGKLKALKDTGEEHKLMWFSDDHCFTHIQEDFCNLYGTPNFSSYSNLDDVSRKAAFRLVMGDERPLIDAVNTKYMLFFGWNPLSSMKWAYLPRIIIKALQNGAKLVVVDPVSSMTAAKANEWVPIRPGTDGAMALAMANVIISENLHDKEFIEEWTHGFDKYAEYVEDKTPKWAEGICDVPAEIIRRIAIEFATTKPSIVDAWSGPGQHSNGVQGSRAIALLAVLTGQVDKPGTLVNPNKKGNKHQKLNYKIEMPRLDGMGTKYPLAHKSGIYCESFNRIIDGKGAYQPKVGVFIFQNPVLEVPGTKNVIDAIKKLEFVVVVDTHMSETAELADIVIPGTTYLERYDLDTQWVTWPVVGLRQPVVDPIFKQMPEYDFIIALGQKLSLRDANGNAFFDNLKYEDYLSKELENGEPKITLKQLKALPGATWISKEGTEYEKFRREVTVPEDATIDEETGVVGDRDGITIGVTIGNKVYKGFKTPTRKLQFYAPELEGLKDADGNPIDPLPVYAPRDWLPDNDYPLYLVNWYEVSHTQSRTFNNPWLIEIKDGNPLCINTKKAKELGIKNGDEVIVESPYSKDRAKVRVTGGIRPDVVGWQRGFGHWGFGKLARGKGTNDCQFNLTKADPISGMAIHKEVCVRVRKA